MYGLEKKGKTPFEFDLESEIKDDPTKGKALLKSIEERIQDLKSQLRKGADSEDFDQLGTLLHGYAALQKVLQRIINKK